LQQLLATFTPVDELAWFMLRVFYQHQPMTGVRHALNADKVQAKKRCAF